MSGWWEFLSFIAATGITGFLLFLLGYSVFSIVKRGKLKRLKKEAEIRQVENIKLENYIKNMDDDLKKEIEAAVNEHSKQFQSSNTTTVDNSDFSVVLAKRIMNLMEKGVSVAEKCFDILSHKIDKKHIGINAEHHWKEQSFMSVIKNAIKETVSQDSIKKHIDNIFENIDKSSKK